ARSPSRLATLSIESSDSFVASTIVSIATGWSEPVPGRELHPLKSSAFHGALFRQLSYRVRVLNYQVKHTCRLAFFSTLVSLLSRYSHCSRWLTSHISICRCMCLLKNIDFAPILIASERRDERPRTFLVRRSYGCASGSVER